MKILLIGATGKTGQKLLAHLSATSHEVVGLIRQEQQKTEIEKFILF